MENLSLVISFWNEFSVLFADMSGIAAICLITGLTMCIVEIFQPGYGIFFGIGIALIFVGIGIRIADNGNYVMFFILVMLCTLVLLAAFIIMVLHARRGWLGRIQSFRSVGTGAGDAAGLYYLLNMTGNADSDLNPTGKIYVSENIFEAAAQNGFIEAGKLIKVVQVEGNKVVVKEI